MVRAASGLTVSGPGLTVVRGQGGARLGLGHLLEVRGGVLRDIEPEGEKRCTIH